jgi:hypothetical protein
MLPRVDSRRGCSHAVPAAALLTFTAACAKDQGPGPKTQAPAVEQGPEESDAPVRLAYVCGNRLSSRRRICSPRTSRRPSGP